MDLRKGYKLHVVEVEVAPYWNVNTIVVMLQQKWKGVEVAPYWNVNSEVLNLTVVCP